MRERTRGMFCRRARVAMKQGFSGAVGGTGGATGGRGQQLHSLDRQGRRAIQMSMKGNADEGKTGRQDGKRREVSEADEGGMCGEATF